eukprot:scaffold17815_cov112-Isochrysis_galbana.AAC.12
MRGCGVFRLDLCSCSCGVPRPAPRPPLSPSPRAPWRFRACTCTCSTCAAALPRGPRVVVILVVGCVCSGSGVRNMLQKTYLES